ncbi:hypothetical protein [Paracoccus homiensis]|uniref:hypothetical protein n=1 Tax=Paracoccus homiensis TaxID=364199 RepID=UPI00398CFFA5
MSSTYIKAMQSQLRAAVKGTGWKQAKGVVFRQSGHWFIAGHWRNVSANPDDGLRIEIMAKPMAIDPLLWEVMGLQENNALPLSFRYWGAIICGTPVLKCEIIDEIDPAEAMTSMVEVLDRLLPVVLELLETKKFSDLAKNPAGIHDNWRMGETIIHSLRLEGDTDSALKIAQSNYGTFSIDRSVKDPRLAGKRHNELIASAICGEAKPLYLKRLIDRILKA